MNTYKKRSGFKVMTSLIGLVKPMTEIGRAHV